MNIENIIILSLIIQAFATWRMISIAIFAGAVWVPFIVSWAVVDTGLIVRRVLDLNAAAELPLDAPISFMTWLTLFNSAATAASIEAFRFCFTRWLKKKKSKGTITAEEAGLLARLTRRN